MWKENNKFFSFLVLLIFFLLIRLKSVSGGTKYLDPIYTVKTSKNIQYGQAVGFKGKNENLLLDLFEPVDSGTERRPLIVFVHGGSFVSGSKEIHDDNASGFAKKGYVGVSINYRLDSSHTPYTPSSPDLHKVIDVAKTDTLSSVKFLITNADQYQIDTSKIFLGGSSAGAMTALYASYSEDPPAETIKGTFSIAGAVLSEDLSIIDSGDPMTIMFHGTADHTVPYDMAQKTEAQLKNKGVKVVMISYQGETHSIIQSENTDIQKKLTDFLYEYLSQQPSNTDQPVSPTVIITPSLTPSPTLSRPPTYPSDYPTPTTKLVVAGDINGDGLIDKLDMNELLNNYLGNIPAADLNNDGIINGHDYFLLSRKLNTVLR